MAFIETAVAALLGSGIGTAGVNWLMSRDRDKRSRRGRTSDAAFDKLAKLKAVHLSVKEGGPDDSLLEVESAAEAEIGKCGSPELVADFQSWRNYGRQYASGDEDTSEDEYQRLFEGVHTRLTKAVEDLS